MYDLDLTAEQLEIRETVRDFVAREIKPIALQPDRLEQGDQQFPVETFALASQMGLRTLSLAQALGGAGADTLTACIVAEELAAGDVAVAAVLARTAMLGHLLFDHAMTPEQRARFLPAFLADDSYHLAFAGHATENDLGWSYHRPLDTAARPDATAVRGSNGDWVVNGVYPFVANAPIAKLIAVEATTGAAPGAQGTAILLVTQDALGFTVREPAAAENGPAGEPVYRWHHGRGGAIELKDCRVPAANLLGGDGTRLLLGGGAMWGRAPQVQAMNLGVGRAAYEAALEYAKLRVQGGRRIIEHQSIALKLAEIAIKLEVARNSVWRAAWAADHPDTRADRSLPLDTIARVFTSEMMQEVTLHAAEIFGAMGVMRDMPMQKYVRDAFIFLHAETGNTAAKLRIAESVAGYRRSPAET